MTNKEVNEIWQELRELARRLAEHDLRFEKIDEEKEEQSEGIFTDGCKDVTANYIKKGDS